MGILFLKRLGMMILVMLVVAFLLFLANEGDPYSIARGVLGPYAQKEQLTIWLVEHGYDKPIPVRFLEWLGRVLTGDLGVSVQYKRPVADIFWSRLGNTGILAAATFAIMVPLALFLGVLAGMKEGSFLDRFISILSIGTTSVPEYASAVLLSVIFVYHL